ncbi:MAG TPA: hypothetical protein VGC36_10180 [Rhizomicrobium sp.]
MTVLRSIGAVIGGFLVLAILSIAMDMAMENTILPGLAKAQATTGEWIFVTAYRAVFSISGCYLAARWAPSAPMAHALALGAVGVVLTSLGAYVMWSLSTHWYPIALIVIALPCAWIGGKLYERSRAAA